MITADFFTFLKETLKEKSPCLYIVTSRLTSSKIGSRKLLNGKETLIRKTKQTLMTQFLEV